MIWYQIIPTNLFGIPMDTNCAHLLQICLFVFFVVSFFFFFFFCFLRKRLNSTDRSKAVVPVLVLLFVALCFILQGYLSYVLPCVILFLCFSVLF